MKSRGFTLIELMIVLALLALMLGLAAPSFQRTIARQKVTATTSDLMASVMQARSEAITNNQQTIVQPLVDSDWSRGWRTYIDTDKSKTFAAGTDQLISTVAPAADTVVQNEKALNDAVGNLIGFNPTGFLLGNNAGRVVFASAMIPAAEYRKGIKISVTGRARVCVSTPGDNGCAASAD